MNNIAHYRKLRGLSQGDLAEIVGLRQPHISRIEKAGDEAEGVPVKVYRAIAKALDVALSDLFSDEMAPAELALIEAFRGSEEKERRMMLALANEARALEPPSGQ